MDHDGGDLNTTIHHIIMTKYFIDTSDTTIEIQRILQSFNVNLMLSDADQRGKGGKGQSFHRFW